ncbi:NAD(P)H-hydrate dehydratase [Blastopirellula sp. J2-11]|uniref:NAD(P)H-hydrate dehydratase n=1 Tax=Blastopirellula sp. J2-11 TaxID=2943192 RepID=UPI0021C862CE|nr:NAD(P)H-hydrate dehydratase [Blastopirellula sp. J2-11]UUO08255.1 NAD(P)H-hydrate dehydratase [Blastopirellula sp. J2-11]
MDRTKRKDDAGPALPRLQPRKTNSHKGDYGRVLAVGGSPGMSGSITLTGVASLRCGAGLTTIAAPKSLQPLIAQFEASCMTIGLSEDRSGLLPMHARSEIAKAAKMSDVVAIGPGLGRSHGLDLLVKDLYCDLTTPMVVDADAINALGSRENPLASPGGPRVLTPHPGEFRRLAHNRELPKGRWTDVAADMAKQNGVVLVLKGHRTTVTDGDHVYSNETGNPGMATAGAGDVLTGVIAALLGQGIPAFEAAQLGVYLHGLAGDLAAKAIGSDGLIASDLLDYLEAAFQQHRRRR